LFNPNPNNVKRIKREYLTRHNNDKSKFKDSSSVEVLFINHALLTKLKIELSNLHKGSFYFSTNRKISLISNEGEEGLINKNSLNVLFEQVFNKNRNDIFCYLLDSKKVNLAIKEVIVILDLLNLNFSMYKKLDQFLKKPQFESSWYVNEKVNTYVYFNEQQKEISFYKYNIE
jgi:hypothetical protein